MRLRNLAVAAVLAFGFNPHPSILNPAGYPWPAQNGWVLDGHGYWEGECTSFVAWAVRTDELPQRTWPDFLGNADRWTASAVVTQPRVGDVAQWDAGYDGADSFGHVAYVIAVGPGASVTVEEYNWYTFHRFDLRTIGPNEPSRYLRF